MSDLLTDITTVLARSRFNQSVSDAALAQQVLDSVALPRAKPKKTKSPQATKDENDAT